MKRRRILTARNRSLLYARLNDYLEEVLEEEEVLRTLHDLWEEAYRVEVYGEVRCLDSALITQWLQGLPIGVMYTTYDIVRAMLEWLGMDSGTLRLLGEEDSPYIEDVSDLDRWYWSTLGRIVYDAHFEEA